MTIKRGRRRASAVAVGLGLALVAPAIPAAAAPTQPMLEWEVSTGEGALIEGPIFGSPIVVPGDSGERILTITNGGPTTGNLVVSIINAQGSFADDGFENIFAVNEVSAAELVGQSTVIHTSSVEPGDSVEVPISFEFPSGHGDIGNSAIVGEQTFSFDVHLNLSGELPVIPDTEAPDTEAPDTEAPAIQPGDTQATDDGTLADTGWSLGTGPIALVGLAALLTALGIVLRAAHRRRQDHTY